MSAKIQIIFYSMYGHIYQMAQAVAAGAREAGAGEVSLWQVPELVPNEILEKSGAAAARAAFAHVPVAKPMQLAEADAIIFGTPTRFGNMAAQMRNFLDQTGGQWMQGKLIGKVRQRLHFDSDAARRSGDHDHFLPQHIVASWLHHRRYALFVPRVAQHG